MGINGVLRGYRYKLRFAYAHFPINMGVEGGCVEIRNFLGEKRVRRQPIPEGVKCYRTDQAKVKDELVVEGNDLRPCRRWRRASTSRAWSRRRMCVCSLTASTSRRRSSSSRSTSKLAARLVPR